MHAANLTTKPSKKLDKEIKDGRLEDALVAAIDAHSLAEDKDAFLQKQEVRLIVERAENKAQNAVDNQNWVEALSLYRLLDLLHEDQRLYTDRSVATAKHLRVMQVYVPEQLQELYQQKAEQRAKEKGEEPPAPVEIDADTWQTKLKGVNSLMLKQSLRNAVRMHIDRNQEGNNGYSTLLIGGIDNLELLLNTKALSEEFASLKDEQQVNRFKAYLDETRQDLKNKKSLTFIDAFNLVDEILQKNDITVDLPREVIVYELTEGSMGTLDDFSAVIWPEDLERFSRSTEGKFSGVGIQISRKDGQLIVVSPLANTPAQKAGLKAGDIISKVNGVGTATWSLDRAVREITGEEGTPVTLTIERKGEPDPIDYKITRASIEIESIRGWDYKEDDTWDYWIDKADGIAYIRLSQFLPQSAQDLDKAIAQLQSEGEIQGLIIDLRFNPGGLLDTAVQVSDRFLNEGTIVSTIDTRNKRRVVGSAHKKNTYPDFPVAILVNQGSASASEILSGALQDYGRATIIGSRSFGKGSVQDVFQLIRNKAYLKLTTQYYMLPNGRIIHRKPEATDWAFTQISKLT